MGYRVMLPHPQASPSSGGHRFASYRRTLLILCFSMVLGSQAVDFKERFELYVEIRVMLGGCFGRWHVSCYRRGGTAKLMQTPPAAVAIFIFRRQKIKGARTALDNNNPYLKYIHFTVAPTLSAIHTSSRHYGYHRRVVTYICARSSSFDE